MKSYFTKSIIGLSTLVMVFLLISCQQKKEEKKKPNILFLFADDQRSGTINALGNQEIITPNLDKLANEGVSFTNTYIMGGSSSAVCAPSRAMLMTGRHLYGIEKQGWQANISEVNETIPETFRRAGYVTFGTGKNHNGKPVFARGFSDGDEIFFGGMSDHWNVPVYHFDSTGKYDKKIPFIRNPGVNNKVEYIPNSDHKIQGKHSSELFADAAIGFLKRHDNKKPFFAYIPFTAPHDPRSMPKEYEQMYDTASIAIPPNFLPEHPWDFGEFKIRDEVLAGFPRTKPEVKTHLRDYYAMITHMDAQIGRIIRALKESGEYENTIIIFSSDNGLAIGQHGLFGKQNLYEHSIGVPFIISGPGLPANERREAFCYLFDVFPTLCELVNIESPETVQGSSFTASIKDANRTHRKNMTYGYKEYMRAYRKKDFKLIEYFVNGERNSQFFNLEQDAYEKNNLFDKDDYSSNYFEMKNEMIQEMKVLNDTNQIYKQLLKEI
ncbi:MAG: sulfatase-like hydrolase/transferase [Thiohalomonadales bacterium]